MTHVFTVSHTTADDHGFTAVNTHSPEIKSGDKVFSHTGSSATFVSVSPAGVVWLCYDQAGETEEEHQERVNRMVNMTKVVTLV